MTTIKMQFKSKKKKRFFKGGFTQRTTILINHSIVGCTSTAIYLKCVENVPSNDSVDINIGLSFIIVNRAVKGRSRSSFQNGLTLEVFDKQGLDIHLVTV